MDFQFPSAVTLILSFFLFLFVLLSLRKGAKIRNHTSPLPPGPWKLPIIGSMHHMVGALPHRALCNLSKKYGPLMQLKMGELDLVVVSSPEAAKEIMMTNDQNFACRPEFVMDRFVPSSVSNMSHDPYGDYWRQLRKICNLELLSPNRVKSFSSVREKEISNLIQYISTKSTTGCSPINLTEQLLTVSNNIVFQAVCGSKSRHQERLTSALMKMGKTVSLFSIAEFFPSVKISPVVTGMSYRLGRMYRHLAVIYDGIITEHQHKTHDEQGRKDFLDVLLSYTEQGNLEVPLTIDNVKSVIANMFSGGTETSANVMEWAIAELMRNPEVMKKAQTEVRRAVGGKEKIEQSDVDGLNYLKMVIKETLRLHPPAPLLVPRICAETCEVGGYKIIAGTTIVINAWAIGRDPKYWVDAESFNPERFYENELDFKGTCFQYLPFGAGRRMCPGIAFGMASVEFVLAQLLFYFDWELPDGTPKEELDMTEAYGNTVYRHPELILLAKAHNIA